MRDDDSLSTVGESRLAARIAKAKAELDRAASGDPDGIHDLRIAIRKVRATLSILAGTLVDPAVVKAAEHDLKELFHALGRARDDDVLTERVHRLAKKRRLHAKTLDRLIEDIAKDRKDAKKDVQRRLKKHRGGAILDELLGAMRRADRLAPDDPNEVGPSLLRHVAGSAVLSRFERVVAYEVAVGPVARAPVLHRLRVAIKKLRYALDFFEGAMPRSARRLDALLSRAQAELGELHDHTVAIERIDAFRATASKPGKTKKLELLCEAEDEEAERLLRVFRRDWAEITSASFRSAIFGAAACVRSERHHAASSRLDVRRLDRAA